MIKEFKVNGKEYGMILGFESLKVLSEAQTKGSGELQIIEDVVFVSINSYARRNGKETISRDDLISMFDDLEVFLEVKDAVEEFSVNFSKKANQVLKKKVKA